MPSYLITGSSRGLGLAFTKELLKDPNNYVIATARNPKGSPGLQELSAQFNPNRLAIIQLDVTDEKSVQNAVQQAEKLLPDGLDNFISSAGVANDALETFEKADLELFRSDLNQQLVCTVMVIRAFLPLIRKSKEKKILAITSVLGSIELGFTMPGVANTYSVVKAGLNMLIRKWGATLKLEEITAFVMHPGWVNATEIGDSITPWMEKYAPGIPTITEPESAEGCMKVLKNATIDDAGAYYKFDGTKLPW